MLEQLAAPSVYPVSLAAAKAWLRETTADSDAVIGVLIRAAIQRVETVTHNALVYRPVRERFDRFPGRCIELSGFPVLAVRSITYLDTAGVQQTVPAADYLVDVTKGAARITPAFGKFFPSTYEVMNAVTVNYDIGHLVPVTAVDANADTIAAAGHNKANDDIVQLSTDGSGVPPAGVAVGQICYAKGVSAAGMQLAASAGGVAIDLGAGYSATVFIGNLPEDMLLAARLMLHTWFDNRADISQLETFVAPAHGAADALLSPYAPRGF